MTLYLIIFALIIVLRMSAKPYKSDKERFEDPWNWVG
jgi:hypothetical protein